MNLLFISSFLAAVKHDSLSNWRHFFPIEKSEADLANTLLGFLPNWWQVLSWFRYVKDNGRLIKIQSMISRTNHPPVSSLFPQPCPCAKAQPNPASLWSTSWLRVRKALSIPLKLSHTSSWINLMLTFSWRSVCLCAYSKTLSCQTQQQLVHYDYTHAGLCASSAVCQFEATLKNASRHTHNLLSVCVPSFMPLV